MKKMDKRMWLKGFGVVCSMVVAVNAPILASAGKDESVLTTGHTDSISQHVVSVNDKTYFLLKKNKNDKILFGGILTDDGVCKIVTLNTVWLPGEVIVDGTRYQVSIDSKFKLKDFDFEVINDGIVKCTSTPLISITNRLIRIYVGEKLCEYHIAN